MGQWIKAVVPRLLSIDIDIGIDIDIDMSSEVVLVPVGSLHVG